jgi:hypothetical protein
VPQSAEELRCRRCEIFDVGGSRSVFRAEVACQRLDLDLVEQRAFDSGLIYARYRTR